MNKTPEEGSIYVIAGVDKARFRQRVLPGDKVDIFSKVLGSTRGIWKFECFAEVNGNWYVLLIYYVQREKNKCLFTNPQ